MRASRGHTTAPCNCVLRAIFRICYRKFKECAVYERYLTNVDLDFMPGKDGRASYGRKNEEYIADFCNLSKRCLTATEHKIFRYHYLLGADWILCCRKLQMDRGSFFHIIYRIEQRLGRVFRELQPYGLYPVDEYFSSSHMKGFQPVRPTPIDIPMKQRRRRPLIAPTKKAA